MSDFFPYWGKAKPKDETQGPVYHPLAYHSLDVAAVGHCLLKNHPKLLAYFAQAWRMPPEMAHSFATFLLAIHDLGKFSLHFQKMVPEVFHQLQPHRDLSLSASTERHDQMGYKLTQDLDFSDALASFLKLPLTYAYPLPKSLFSASLCHHGIPPKNPRLQISYQNFPEQDQSAALSFCKSAASTMNLNLDGWRFSNDDRALNESSFILAGLAMVCDWLGSNQVHFKYRDVAAFTSPIDYWEQTKNWAQSALVATHLLPVPVRSGQTMRDFYRTYTPTHLQQMASSVELASGPQLFFMEDLTGSGKTEAALVLAYRLMEKGLAHGTFVALPTMATADQMFERVSGIYSQFYQQPASCVLAHGQRHLSQQWHALLGIEDPPKEHNLAREGRDEYAPASALCNEWLADSLKKCLLGAVGIGTVDQVMLGALFVKHHAMRLYGLFGKVLILDEIHAYDTYMTTILETILQFHARTGGSAILLSATLPLGTRQRLTDAFCDWHSPLLQNATLEDRSPKDQVSNQAFPEFTHVALEAGFSQSYALPANESRTIHIQFTHNFPAEQVLSWANEGLCVCWIRNTVLDAVDAYQHLRMHLPKDRITLFHARFPMGQRLELQGQLLAEFGKGAHGPSRKGRIVIATQVVEQSLDIDFDRVLSDLAPMDLLLQRLGRQMRHCRDTQGNFIAQGPDVRGPRIFTVYAPEFDPDPQADWYGRTFPRAKKVYQATFLLWHTQRLLLEKSTIHLPEDTRALIEGVYGEIAVPPGLREIEDKSYLENSCHRSLGKENTKVFGQGYADSKRDSENLNDTFTRLGLDTVTLRLALFENGQFRPLACADGIWEKSQVSVPRYYGHQRVTLSEDQEVVYQQLCEELPDHNRRILFLPLTPENHVYQGTTLVNDRLQTLIYHPDLGLLRKEDLDHAET